MRLTRVFVAEPLQGGAPHVLHGDAAAHLGRVLRLRAGASLTVFDGRGGEYPATIETIRRDEVRLAVGAHRAVERESSLEVTLAQGVSRGERMDWIIQKATELGVRRIVPVLTAHSVVQLDAEQAEKRARHWRGVAIAACEQCGRNRLPQIAAARALDTWLGEPEAAAGTRLLLDPQATGGLADVGAPEGAATLLIGPEGGLSDAEQSLAREVGFLPVRLGPRILRTESAAVVALALVQQRWGDLR
jgi:16S rRNA (uracil1498-N3)-methyltransferase